jgi:hypothetical protein
VCTCPPNFVPPAPEFSQVFLRKNTVQFPGLITGAGLISAGAKSDAVLIAFDPANIPLGKDIDLASARHDLVRVGFGLEVVPLTSVRSAYAATAGTLRITDACEQGVSGELTTVQAAEVDIFDGFAPIAGGCTIAVSSMKFTLGSCADAGVSK